MKVSIPNLPAGDVLVYKFGCRLDSDCLQVVNDQISLSRKLYNDLIADMRKVVDARAARELELGGEAAQAVKRQIVALNEAFDAAKAANNEDGMKAAANERRAQWAKLSEVLKSVRAEHKAELRGFLAGIGRNSSCSSYQIRSQYVGNGLGWATANAVLEDALKAFQDTIKKGQAPRFAIGAEITRDSLNLQFTAAGGVAADVLLSGAHTEMKVRIPSKGFGRRCYGAFSMRMGAAKADKWANGTWQAHRPIPDGAHVAGMTLVREKVGNKFEWNIQFLVKLSSPKTATVDAQRKPLAAIHLGWSADSSGRRIGAIASAPDAGLAKILQLPQEIEDGLCRSSEIKSRRDTARDKIVPVVKAFSEQTVSTWPQELQDEFRAIKRLPVQHIAMSRLHRLWWMLNKAGLITSEMCEFNAWRKIDRIEHQSEIGLSRGARNRRKDFYRNMALRQCQEFESIVLDVPDLKVSAIKIDEATGERNELGRKARAGRVVAALYEYTNALSWAAARCGTTIIEVDGSTASGCSSCGAIGLQTVEGTQFQQQSCPHCGAVHDKKCNAAAMAYQQMVGEIEDLEVQAAEQAVKRATDLAQKKQEKLTKVQASRRQRMANENA